MPPPPQNDEEEEEEEEDEEEEEEEEASSSSLAGQVTIAVAGSHRSDEKKPPASSAALDDSRRLFQRLWTDEDEMELLQGFLDYTTQQQQRRWRGTAATAAAHHHDTALFYDQIRAKLQLEFNKSQLVEKLRRLKKKYRNATTRIASGKDLAFKTPHDQATFQISHKIWGDAGQLAAADENAFDDDDSKPNPNPNPIYCHNTDGFGFGIGHDPNVNTPEKKVPAVPASGLRKRPRGKSPEKHNVVPTVPINNTLSEGCSIPSLVEETLRSCLSPFFRELLQTAMGVPGGRGLGGMAAALNPIPLNFWGMPMMSLSGGDLLDERWRKQQVLELEVYAKRLQLVQDQIKSALEDLASMGS